MSLGFSDLFRTARRGVFVALAVAFVTLAARPALAQDVITKESAAALKTTYLADLDGMRTKFIGLAQAFPAEKYTWRPMEGVRSVSEVLMLIAIEGYTFAPSAVGGKPGGPPREEMAKLRTLSDKAQVIDHLNKGFDNAKASIEAVDPATLTGMRKMMNRDMSAVGTVMLVSGDMHEHLGQLIAYARMNQIVPPWSK